MIFISARRPAVCPREQAVRRKQQYTTVHYSTLQYNTVHHNAPQPATNTLRRTAARLRRARGYIRLNEDTYIYIYIYICIITYCILYTYKYASLSLSRSLSLSICVYIYIYIYMYMLVMRGRAALRRSAALPALRLPG